MKTYSVYVLKDTVGKIVYVGMTSLTLKQRLKHHIYSKKGKFYFRKDISIHLFDTFNTRKEALDTEAVLKFELGFRHEIITDDQLKGVVTIETQKGIFDPKNRQKVLQGSRKGGSIGGLKGGKINLENNTGLFNPKNQQKVNEGKIKGRKKVKELYSEPLLVYTKNGQFVGEYSGQREAAREMTKLLGKKVEQGGIGMVIRGKGKSYKGHIFKRK